MKAEYANPFIKSAVMIFQQELNIELNRRNLQKKESPQPSLPICIIIGTTGDVKGQIVYSMDENFAYNVAKSMLPGKLPVDLRKLTNSAVSEIANMITGRASIFLAGESGFIDITPPAVFSGNNIRFDFLTIPTISLKFISVIGELEINIALTDN